MLNWFSDILISFTMVENGGLDPKFNFLFHMYNKVWPIFDFSRGCLATKFQKFLFEFDGNLIIIVTVPYQCLMNMFKVLNIPQNVQSPSKCAIISILRRNTYKKHFEL